jgi:hypothetical protein
MQASYTTPPAQTGTDNNLPVLQPEQQEKLRELTAQSWNLELAISGVAMFAILQLPDALDMVFDYLRFNAMSHTTGVQAMMPSLAYSVIKVMCYVLFGAFMANFVMRAFWVGLVGLLAVYPSGIHYDRIPFSTPYAQKRLAEDLGPLEGYILRLDQRCNIVFAVAFLFVFFLIFITVGYVVTFLGYAVVRPLLPVETRQTIKLALNVLGGVYFLVSMILIIPKVKAHPIGEKLHYRVVSLNRLMYGGLYKPLTFILNTFYSHIPRLKLLLTAMLMMLAFFVLFMVEFMADMSRADSRLSNAFTIRHLYTARVDSRYVNPTAYDNQRVEGESVVVASIQADVVREPFIRLYVAYPKALDTLLTTLAKEPKWDSTLSRAEVRQRFAEWSSDQIGRLMQITVNDSLYPRPDLLTTQRGKQHQRGWQTILIPDNLRRGKNTIQVGIKADSLAKMQELITIPFWYVPE